MTDEATIARVAEAIAHRVADRLSIVLDEDPRFLEGRLVELDGWTLATLLRVSRSAVASDAERPRLGVVGVHHSLNQLVIEQESGRETARDLESVDLDQLDDEDLIAAAHYVPETLPGYLLG